MRFALLTKAPKTICAFNKSAQNCFEDKYEVNKCAFYNEVNKSAQNYYFWALLHIFADIYEVFLGSP